MSRILTIALALLCFATAALGKDAAPDQDGSEGASASQPHAVGKPVTTTTIKRCPDGYELVNPCQRPAWLRKGCDAD